MSKFHVDTIKILQEAGWLGFLSTFSGYSVEVTKAFTYTFDVKMPY
jgi:fluoride ion exporter CrcB/FEX